MGGTQRILRAAKLRDDTRRVDTRHYTFVKTLRRYSTKSESQYKP